MRGTILAIILLLSQTIMVTLPSGVSVSPEDCITAMDMDVPSIIDPVSFSSPVPNAYTENRGQLDNSHVRYYSQDGSIWFTDDGIWFSIFMEETEEADEMQDFYAPGHMGSIDPLHPEGIANKAIRSLALKQEFIGSNHSGLAGRERLAHDNNYFLGNDSERWQTGVPNFREVWYRDLWTGIDLRYYSSEMGPKYDLIVHPGAEVSDIRICYKGSDGIAISDTGELQVETQVGTFKENRPYIYQPNGRTCTPVDGGFTLFGNGTYGFALNGGYDLGRDLVIDPLIEYSTYLGTSMNDYIWHGGAYANSNGSLYLCGTTTSPAFPLTPGAFDTVFSNGEAFITKLSPNGSVLLYSTYLGGYGYGDGFADIIEVEHGNVLLVGQTCSDDFPVTSDAYDMTYNSPGSPGPYYSSDAIICKLNNNGSALLYSTYFGGIWNETAWGLVLDEDGNVCIGGDAQYSQDFPTTPGAYSTSFSCGYGYSDCFVARFNISRTSTAALLNSTLLGGSHNDYVNQMDIHPGGDLVCMGNSWSQDFPTTPGAVDTSFNGGFTDGIVFVISKDCSQLTYASYLGGSEWDVANTLDIDTSGNLYIGGGTYSPNFPTTSGALDTTLGGLGDCYITKINISVNGSSSLVFSTFLGGSTTEGINDFILDKFGNILSVGGTYSSDFPLTSDAMNKTLQGSGDAFFTILKQDGSTLLYSTYLGGSLREFGCLIALDPYGGAYMLGETFSRDFPVTPGAYCTVSPNPVGMNINSVFITKMRYLDYDVYVSMPDTASDTLYSRLKEYTYRVDVTDAESLAEVTRVELHLDPEVADVRLRWRASTGKFTVIQDPFGVVTLQPSSVLVHKTPVLIRLDFNILFDWSFPHEKYCEVKGFAIKGVHDEVWDNRSDFFRIENDLTFAGKLTVVDGLLNKMTGSELVKGGETLRWTGLIPVYQGNESMFPPRDEFGVAVWNETHQLNSTSVPQGNGILVNTSAGHQSFPEGNLHRVNFTGIPPECDKSNETFLVRIDADDVVFTSPTPSNTTWCTQRRVDASVNATDVGGAMVDGSTVKRSRSLDGGTTWTDWSPVRTDTNVSVLAESRVTFEDGTDNYIKWSAQDTLGNGPAESPPFQVLVDTEMPYFSQPLPTKDDISKETTVEVRITIHDLVSGVSGSSVEYSVSYNSGVIWNPWLSVNLPEDGSELPISMNVSFENTSTNSIRFRAWDVAGNGPAESDPITVRVDTWVPTENLITVLKEPLDGSTVETVNATLSWDLWEDTELECSFDVYFGVDSELLELKVDGHTIFDLTVHGLEDGTTYHWTVIPQAGDLEGKCRSGIWSFTCVLPATVPKVELISPEDGAQFVETTTVLTWRPVGPAEQWTYRLYFGENRLSLPPIESDYAAESYEIGGLSRGVTYHWTVTPVTAEGIRGEFGEQIWSFTVLDPEDWGVYLSPIGNITITPGETIRAGSQITNTGRASDNFQLILVNDAPENTFLFLIEQEMHLGVSESRNLGLMISATNDSMPGQYLVSVVAVSDGAKQSGIDVRDNVTFSVTVLMPSTAAEEPVDNKDSSTGSSYLLILIVVIIATSILLTLLLVIRRQKRKQEGGAVQDTSEIIKADSMNEGLHIPEGKPTLDGTKLTATTGSAENVVCPRAIPVSNSPQTSELPPRAVPYKPSVLDKQDEKAMQIRMTDETS